MQYTDNNMDELFRKAAARYPLKTGEKNWEAVSAAASSAAVPDAVAHKNKPGILPALLLSFLLMGIPFLLFPPLQHKASASFVVQAINSQDALPVQVQKRMDIVKPAAADKLKSTCKAANHKANRPVITNNIKSFDQPIEQNDGNLLRLHLPVVNPALALPPAVVKASAFIAVNKSNTTIEPLLATTKAVHHNANGFYFGAEGGLQWNQVKSQGFNRPGWTAGIVAGWRLSPALAVETGIALSQKYYFTDGKYFDMHKAAASMPANMSVTSLSGSSHLLEWPVSLAYNIQKRKKSTLFIKAGIVSYILTHESNDYLAVINGQQQNAAGKYNEQHGYFAAVAQFAMGYQYNAGKKLAIRIEPYIQTPIKGIGVGGVQVMTAGLHIGLLRFPQH